MSFGNTWQLSAHQACLFVFAFAFARGDADCPPHLFFFWLLYCSMIASASSTVRGAAGGGGSGADGAIVSGAACAPGAGSGGGGGSASSSILYSPLWSPTYRRLSPARWPQSILPVRDTMPADAPSGMLPPGPPPISPRGLYLSRMG
eukprot:366441-Chlamydomonas_euryale.AAC.12